MELSDEIVSLWRGRFGDPNNLLEQIRESLSQGRIKIFSGVQWFSVDFELNVKIIHNVSGPIH